MTNFKPRPAHASIPSICYESHNSQFMSDATWIVITTPINVANSSISNLNDQMIEMPP